ncbi:MAG: hypothetical protein JW795_17805 [Chitinivibrionales bacterium]|nr:hypothetical protein [Chitinivibrionales bacterium]
MWIFQFYRFFISVGAASVSYFFFFKNIWFSFFIFIIIRSMWFGIEKSINRFQVNASFKKHIPQFKQLYGPYGIRIANKADSENHIKKSLSEVFTEKKSILKKNVENLEVMDTLFKSGLRPEGDSYLLHDLKLKYGKYRLEKLEAALQNGKTTIAKTTPTTEASESTR